jgi:hypothetical protein
MLVGIAVEAAVVQSQLPASDPVRAELPDLLRSVEALLATLDRLVERLPVLEAQPA